MIVVVGDPTLRFAGGGIPALAGGSAAALARACVRAGATVQLAGKVGDDPAGDEILLALTRDGIGHVALLRDAGATTRLDETSAPTVTEPSPNGDLPRDEWAVAEDDDSAGAVDPPDPAAEGGARHTSPESTLAPEDLDLALRYLSTFAVLIVAQPLGPATLAVAVESAAYAGAHLILIDVPDAATAAVASVPVDDITALESPPTDPDGVFTALVGRYAAALDGGTPAAAAFRAALGAAGWEAATL
ncbi:MAG TPA: PfkB family carbohydrate kinase [Candidatus Limnocylindrales bacterium]